MRAENIERKTMTKMSPSPIANPNLPKPPTGKYPAKDHCRRVAKWIAENGGPASGVIYLEGTGTHMKEVNFDGLTMDCAAIEDSGLLIRYCIG